MKRSCKHIQYFMVGFLFAFFREGRVSSGDHRETNLVKSSLQHSQCSSLSLVTAVKSGSTVYMFISADSSLKQFLSKCKLHDLMM